MAVLTGPPEKYRDRLVRNTVEIKAEDLMNALPSVTAKMRA